MTYVEVIFRVICRKWTKIGIEEVIALFPYVVVDFDGNCSSYMHVGQHSSASYSYMMLHSRPATELEYADLKLELENIGYVLKIIQRRNHERFIKMWEDVRKEKFIVYHGETKQT